MAKKPNETRPERSARLRREAKKIAPGTRVKVYRNLHDDVFSIKAQVGRSWIVVGHAYEVNLTDVTFFVDEADRDKVRVTRSKNVHAWTDGKWAVETPDTEWVYVRYNPYETDWWTHTGTGDLMRSSAIVRGVTEANGAKGQQKMYVPA